MRRKIARDTLDRLKDLDRRTTTAYYEMGRLLSSISHGRLYDELGYDSMTHLIDEELSFSPTTGFNYLRIYRHFQRLKYTPRQAVELLNRFGLRNMGAYLPTAKVKTSVTSVGATIRKRNADQREITFWTRGDDYNELVSALQEFGCEVSESGYLQGSSSALLRMVRHVRGRAKPAQIPFEKSVRVVR